MTQDKGRHRMFRKNILKELQGKGRVISSHEGEGDIVFFREVNGERVYLAEPDIVILTEGCALVVEIELGNSPKRLMGVAFAIHSSEQGYIRNESIDITKKSLLLVLDSEKINKKGSGKQRQIQEVKSLIQNQLDFEYVDIVTEKDAQEAVITWVGIKEEKK